MQQLVETAIRAHTAYEAYLTNEANRITELIKSTAEALKKAKIPGGFVYTVNVEIETNAPPEMPTTFQVGVGWDGERLVYYDEQIAPSWALSEMPNLLGEKREIRIQSERHIEGLLNDIANHYHSQTP